MVIYEPDELSETLGRMLAANPAIALFTGIRPETNRRPITESLDRERNRGFVIVRLHINNEDVSGSTITHEATATRR